MINDGLGWRIRCWGILGLRIITTVHERVLRVWFRHVGSGGVGGVLILGLAFIWRTGFYCCSFPTFVGRSSTARVPKLSVSLSE